MNDVGLIYKPHPAQVMIHKAREARFRVVCTGRRFGKTLCMAAEVLDQASRRPGVYGWVAPTYNVAERGIEAFHEVSGRTVSVSGRAPSRVDFCRNGESRVWFLSADNAENIRGYGFQGLVIDEAALIPVNVWNYVLRPTIAQTLGWAVFISTPKGRNWFYDMHTRGNDPAESEYRSFTFPSNVSPFFPASEWEDARRVLPEDVFRQEYMAEFLEDSAGVFRGVDKCLIQGEDWKKEGTPRQVVIGCDLAKHTDWTVLVAMDVATGRCFAMERFNQLDWPVQKARIADFARRYYGRVILDATGIGDPIYDDLRAAGLRIEGFKLSAASKTDVIRRLIVNVEQQQVMWPAEWTVLTNEMKRYEYEYSPSGHLSYSAPAGYHDDCVMALALANQGRHGGADVGTMCRLGVRKQLFARRSRVLDGY